MLLPDKFEVVEMSFQDMLNFVCPIYDALLNIPDSSPGGDDFLFNMDIDPDFTVQELYEAIAADIPGVTVRDVSTTYDDVFWSEVAIAASNIVDEVKKFSWVELARRYREDGVYIEDVVDPVFYFMKIARSICIWFSSSEEIAFKIRDNFEGLDDLSEEFLFGFFRKLAENIKAVVVRDLKKVVSMIEEKRRRMDDIAYWAEAVEARL
jgi:hypothetical protein